jgi:thioesterase domain-containing protein
MSASKLIRPPASHCSSTEPPEVFLFPGLGGAERELHVLRVGCAPALRGVPVDFPDWTEIYASGINLDGLIGYCMEQIETHAPNGPLRLAGYSFGGIIAFAVASALAASGRAVARLGMLDTPTMPSFVNTRLSPTDRWQRISGAVRRGETSAELGRLVAGVLARSQNPWLLRGAARIRHVRLPLDMDQHIAVPLQMRFRLVILRELINRMAAVDVPLDIPAILFRCVEQEPGETDDLGWRRYLANLQIVPVAGNHLSVIEPANIPSLCASFVAAMG